MTKGWVCYIYDREGRDLPLLIVQVCVFRLKNFQDFHRTVRQSTKENTTTTK